MRFCALNNRVLKTNWLLIRRHSGEAGLSSLGVPGVPWHTQILANQLTLFQPGGKDYAHLITTGTSGFSDLPTALGGSTYVLHRHVVSNQQVIQSCLLFINPVRSESLPSLFVIYNN